MNQLSFTERLTHRLSAEEQLLWDVLQEHRGKDLAITNRELALQTGIQERVVRIALKALTEDHGKPIGSLPGLGVFVIDSRSELDEVLNFYKGHSLSLLRRMCVLKGSNARHICGQLELELRELLEQSAEV